MNKIRKLLCKIGFHKWKYNEDKTRRWCTCCGYVQELWAGLFWEECIDGVPIKKWYDI